MLKQLQTLILILFLTGFFPDKVFAQFPYAESFMNSTAPGINFGGAPTAFLTSGMGSDAVGNGYLRLTASGNSQKGYAFSSNSFPSSKGISVNFEYFTYGGNGADGICFFLYDASVADGSFNVGSYGGGLGYTDISSTGLTRGYLGIGLDEFGNFCTTNAGGRGPTRTAKLPNSVTIRGAYNDPNGAYYMLNTVQLAQATHGFSTIGSGVTTRVAAGNTGYRKVYIDILPHSAGVGFDITVKIKYDAVSTPVTIINNYYYNKAAPANLKFGYAASTGGSTNYHEIRNTSVSLPPSTALSTPTQTDQSLTACSTGSGSVNISGGFSTTNSPNGAINTASVDLDPTTTGIQTTYAVASKGTFTTDGNGNIIFTPLNIGVIGTASCSFTVNDNYGATSNTATVTATIITGPALTVTNPSAVCAPSTVDLTASAVTAGSDNNLTFSYFSDAAATIALSNPSAVASSGTYYIKAINSNNCAVIKPVTVVINPLPTTSNAGSDQNITAAIPASATLNGNTPVYGTGLWLQVSGPTTATFSNAAQYNTLVSSLNPGTYVFSWTITNSCGTSASNVTITVLGTQSIAFGSIPTKTYGDADFTISASTSSGLAVGYASNNPAVATVDNAGNIHILTAGTTNITASQSGNSSYAAATPVTQILTVNKASLTITADNQTKAYGAANPALTVSYSGFVNGENSTSLTAQPAISTTATAASAVGNYPITVTGGASVNYQITYVNGVLSVGQSTPAITFNALPVKVYGDADFNLSATASSGLPVSYSSSNPAIATVNAQGRVHILSAGTVVITASQSGNGSYNPAVAVPQTLTVNRAALTISAENKTKQYVENNPAFTVSYSGFVNGENSTNLSAQPTVNTTATATSATGTYPLTVTGATAANYRIIYVNGVFTIFPGTQTITFVASPRTYGEPDFTLSAVASSGLPVTYSSSNTAVATVDANGQVHIVAAGNVIITASQPGNGNFIATTNINQQLTINKAVLVVKADDLTKVYGAANPPLTVSYSGFVYADNNTNLTTQPVVLTAVTAASAVGVYPVTVAGAASMNYIFVYQAGTLSVGQNNQEITFAALSEKNYGDADFTLAGSSTSGLPITYTSSDPSVATVDAAGTVHILSAGTTAITANQTGNENYSGAAEVAQILTINKAPLIITANNQSKTYGTANPTLTFTYTGFVNAETSTSLATTPTINTTAAPTSAAGVYPISISDATAANYAITFTPGTLTIAKAALTVTADDKARVYGLANPPFTITYSGFVNGETAASLGAAPQLATTANASSPAGIYPITMSSGLATNYNFTFVPGTLTVTNATINSISLAQISLLENQPIATLAGTLAATSLDPAAVYTYSLVAGTGAADNASFAIAGNKVVTTRSLDYEQKAGYSILVRATNQYGLYLDQVFSINIVDVNEAPTLAAIANQTVCYSLSIQNIGLSGITGGPESTQNNNLSVSSTNPRLFKNLSVTAVSGGTATLNYQLTGSGTAAITVTNQDNGGTANGGTDSFNQTFTITANDMPVANITSDKGTQILKGQTVTLTASGGGSYSWDNAFGITGSTSSAIIQVRPNQTTTYQVKVSNASGCSTLSSITINVADDYAAIRPANILTPNGDGKNDTWVVKNIDLYPNNTISIFDRGGRKLIEVKGYNNDWDGTLNGSPLAEGTYYYVIDFGTGVPLKGFITILRNR